MIDRNTNVQITDEAIAFAKPMLCEGADSFSLLFSKPKEIQFIDMKFDFELSPDHFIESGIVTGKQIGRAHV